MAKKYDIGLAGNWSSPNYGAHLTHYALYRLLKECNYSVLMIETPRTGRRAAHVSEKPPLFRVNPYGEDELAPVCSDPMELQPLNECCESFMTGSDQLWNYDIFGLSECYTLAFVHGKKRKLAYGTSFGGGLGAKGLPEGIHAKMNCLLNRFQKVSVREKEGAEFCRSNFGMEAEWVLDPVFLCGQRYYMELLQQSAAKPQSNEKEPYIFCYITAQTERKRAVIQELLEHFGRKAVFVYVYYRPKQLWAFEQADVRSFETSDCKVEDWLAYLYHSSMVITDSYHGYCFSLIFHKQVISLFTDEIKAKRAASLAQMLGLPNPGIADERFLVEECLSSYRIEYASLAGRLEQEKSRCIQWLMDALQSPVHEEKQDLLWDAIGLEVLCLNNRYHRLQREFYQLKLKGRQVIVFGTGKCFEQHYQQLEELCGIAYVTDNDPAKWGNLFWNKAVCIRPQQLVEFPEAYIVIMLKDRAASKAVRKQLEAMKVRNIIHLSELMEI